MKKFLILYIVLVAGLLFVPIAHGIAISTAIPGANPNSTSSAPGAFIANFYQFALMIGGILAFGVIVFGGIKYMASAGNPSGQTEGKEWIWGALTGLLLLAGAYLVLKTINPQLLNLNLPPLNAVPAGNNATVPGPSTEYGCVAANGVVACSPSNKSDCSDVANGACNGKSCAQVQASQCGSVAPATNYGCIAANGVVACSPAKKSDCSDVPNGACGGKTCMQVQASQCGTGTDYGCVAANGVVACSPSNKSGCSDVANGACGGRICIQVESSQCGKTAPATTYGCIASNGVEACSPGGKSDCSDVGNGACSGKTCSLVAVSKCGTVFK